MSRPFPHRPHRGKSDVWLTPPEIVRDLGPFDLDPCAAPEPRPWPTAERHITEADGDGLAMPWEGFVFLNPPFGPLAGGWLAKLADHPQGGLALTMARTDTAWFHREAFEKASALFFLEGRPHFYRPSGERAPFNSGAPVVIMGYAREAVHRLRRTTLAGQLVVRWAHAFLLRTARKNESTWRRALQEAMAGRELPLRDIYRAAEGTSKVREAKDAGHNWRAQVRRTLQRDFRQLGPATWGYRA